jgi:RNA polymerase sigma factor (sigma-70 family)
VARCLQGDEEAWSELWVRYGPLVKAVALRVGCTAEEAREVVQQVGLVAVKSLHKLLDPAKLAGWLAATARFQALAIKRQRQPHAELDPAQGATASAIDELLVQQEQLTLMWQAFAELDPRCQRLLQRLNLKEPADSYEDVAAAEGLAPSSIGSIRNRCLQRLRKLMQSLSRSDDSTHCTGGG